MCTDGRRLRSSLSPLLPPPFPSFSSPPPPLTPPNLSPPTSNLLFASVLALRERTSSSLSLPVLSLEGEAEIPLMLAAPALPRAAPIAPSPLPVGARYEGAATLADFVILFAIVFGVAEVVVVVVVAAAVGGSGVWEGREPRA